MRCALRDRGAGRLAGPRLRPGLRRRRGPRGPLLNDPVDPFDTAGLRAALLAAWADSPTRFREDANAEEDLVLGGYAATWFVELAQNAADAAGVPGRVRVAVAEDELRVANTGAPLTAAGVAALASLRASAKRDDPGSAGRFGVGFAAVLPLSSAPRVVVGTGVGVRFSEADTLAAVRELPGPAAELARRGGDTAPGRAPVLRLVWPVEADEPGPPAGYTTEVRLPLREPGSAARLLAAARAAAPDLLLALPDLAEIEVDGAVVSRSHTDGVTDVGGARYRLVRAVARVDEPGTALEERGRRERGVCWALPVSADGSPAPFAPDAGEVLHAPTPSAERLSLPARLLADLPMDPDRRRFRAGPAADAVLGAAASAYVELVRAVAPADRLSLVPAPGFPLSELDGALRTGVLEELAGRAWLPAAQAEVSELVPRRAEWLDLPGADGLAALLAAADDGFARLAAVDPRDAALLTGLGVRRVSAAELTDRLHAVEREPGWWRGLYAVLEPALDTVPGLAEDLRALPVPLVDGRLVAGPPSVVIGADEGGGSVAGRTLSSPSAGEASGEWDRSVPGRTLGSPSPRVGGGGFGAVAALGLPGLHVVAPEAVHPLLRRLGAREVDGPALLEHPALRAAVERSVDDAEAGLDPAPLAAAVLGLLREPTPGFGALALPDDEGVPSRADELVLPDAAVRPLLDADAPVGVLAADWAARFPREALVAAGVLDGFAVVVDEEPTGPDHDLHDEDLWWDRAGDAEPTRVVAVRDLDLVADDAWPGALALLAGTPATRAALLEPGGYTSWWLARHALLAGREPGFWRSPSAETIAGLYDPAPSSLDDAVLAAVGVRTGLAVADTREAADLLERLADPSRTVSPELGARAHEALADAVADGRVDVAALDLPDRVRSLAGTVVSVDDAVVLDAPWTAAVLPAAELVVGGEPTALAEILDLPLASEVVAGEVVGAGRAVAWVDLPEVVVACRTAGLAPPAGFVWSHDTLEIDLTRPEKARRRVPTWVDEAGRVHADDPVRALLAHRAAHPGRPAGGAVPGA
ncbi:sacsin N-terminal ATP-binding-like domain-containing protein [Pseudonocardia oroxyli]|uniref:sacsin N-terminal ATP-binding-like domain-containing protein n=1 Tax=Pseudonocardia oroxyli TaxID=366584 RepID=UPI000B82DB64|nr:hypothetical protein [Pseudonocardia oroxyli]